MVIASRPSSRCRRRWKCGCWVLPSRYERIQFQRAHHNLVAALDPGQPGHAAVERLGCRSVMGLDRPDDQWVGERVPGAAARYTPTGIVCVGCGCPLRSPAAGPDCRQPICHWVVGWGDEILATLIGLATRISSPQPTT